MRKTILISLKLGRAFASMHSLNFIDLHEDISAYYVRGGSGLTYGLSDFDLDMPGRHMDIPKLNRANTRIIISSAAHLSMSLSEHHAKMLSQGYGLTSWGSRIRAPMLSAIEHMQAYHALERRYPESIKIVLSSGDVENILESKENKKIGFLLAIEGAEPIEDLED